MSDTDIHFYFDPVCPFAWMTSKWVRRVTAQRDYTVDWRFISLRLINAAVDYESHFPPRYEAGHIAGLNLLRVAARVRAEYGRDKVGPLYEAIGTHVFDTEPDEHQDRVSLTFLEPTLATVGLPAALADALEDTSIDAELQRETDEALGLTGTDVGTPIILEAGDVIDVVVLLTSELVTNAMVHGQSAFEVGVSAPDGAVRVAVTDDSGRLPVLLQAGQLDEGGRGLPLVDELSERWGVVSTDRGKTVWFCVKPSRGRILSRPFEKARLYSSTLHPNRQPGLG